MNETNQTPPNENNVDAKTLWQSFRAFVVGLFDMRSEKENELLTIEHIKADVDFRGSKLSILICAIFIASLGLNVNSAAVIIGAMLISPLMGPIIGFGLGIGIMDFELVKRALRNLGLATLFSVLTAALYFFISPLSEAQSELLARTQPTLYDVLIAFFGGAAGIIAGSSRNKGNVIPGVAIATALMPPLCTAGYGLGTGQWAFFFGAFYLYIINSVIIGLATFIIVRLFKFPLKVFVDKARQRKVRKLITAIAFFTVAPSIYLSVQLFKEKYIEDNVKQYVKEVVASNEHIQIVKQSISGKGKEKAIELLLIGPNIPQYKIDSMAALLPSYGLKDMGLKIRQGLEAKTDMNELKSVLLKDLYENSDKIIQRQYKEIDSLQNLLAFYSRFSTLEKDIASELTVIFPNLNKLQLIPTTGVAQGRDSVLVVLVQPKGRFVAADQRKLESWIATRSRMKQVKLIIDNNTKN